MRANLFVYMVVNSALVIVWLATRSAGDPFWPIWSIGLWGIGVIAQAWHAYGPASKPITEADIDRELARRS